MPLTSEDENAVISTRGDVAATAMARPAWSYQVDRIVWAAWWAGTALVVLSWSQAVSQQLGWIGFGVACLSSVTSVIAKRYWRVPPEDAGG